MTKRPAGRKTKAVKSEIHESLVGRVEEFTDSANIASAKKKIVDYQQVTKMFSDADDLPESDFIPETVIEPVQKPLTEEQGGLDDIDSLLSGIDGEKDPLTESAKESSVESLLDEVSDSDFSMDDLEDDAHSEDADLEGMFNVSDDEDDSIVDSDLFNDPDEDDDVLSRFGRMNAEEEEQSRFGRVNDDDEGDDDIFGIPSAVQEPTPYGNKDAKSDFSNIDDDDFMSDDDEVYVPSNRRLNQERNILASLNDDENEDMGFSFGDDDDDDKVDDLISKSVTTEKTTIKTNDTTLDDLMGIAETPAIDDKVVQETTVVEKTVDDGEGVVTEKTETVKKKRLGFLPSFGKKKAVKKEVIETDDEVIEKEETVIRDEDGSETRETVVKTKKTGLKKAVVPLALLGVLGGSVWALDTFGIVDVPYINDAPAVVVKKETKPLVADSTPSEQKTADAATPTVSTPENAGTITSPDISINVDGTTENSTVKIEMSPADATTVPNGAGMKIVMALPDDEQTATITDTTLNDLYSAGTSISDVALTQQGVDEISARLITLSDLVNKQKESVDAAVDRVKLIEGALADRDDMLSATQESSETARTTAEEAKSIAMAQNKVLVEVVGVQDKMKMAEELIVDLSKRLAAIESNDEQSKQILELNDQISELNEDIAMLARTVITNGVNLQNQKQAEAVAQRAHEQAQAAVDKAAADTAAEQTKQGPAGSGAVYETEEKLLTPPQKPDNLADVKVGDDVPGYGKVLEITPTSDGARLIVMEQGSKIVK